MDQESTTMLKILLVGFAVIVLFLLWVGFTEAGERGGVFLHGEHLVRILSEFIQA